MYDQITGNRNYPMGKYLSRLGNHDKLKLFLGFIICNRIETPYDFRTQESRKSGHTMLWRKCIQLILILLTVSLFLRIFFLYEEVRLEVLFYLFGPVRERPLDLFPLHPGVAVQALLVELRKFLNARKAQSHYFHRAAVLKWKKVLKGCRGGNLIKVKMTSMLHFLSWLG